MGFFCVRVDRMAVEDFFDAILAFRVVLPSNEKISVLDVVNCVRGRVMKAELSGACMRASMDTASDR